MTWFKFILGLVLFILLIAVRAFLSKTFRISVIKFVDRVAVIILFICPFVAYLLLKNYFPEQIPFFGRWLDIAILVMSGWILIDLYFYFRK